MALPDVLVTELREHIAEYAEDGTEGLVFTSDRDGPLRRGNFHRATAWTRTVVAAGLPSGFHFHDLRHTGNHFAATAGASTRELMHRMGHGSMRAALIYQHATTERDRAIAQRLSDLVQGDEDSTEDDVGQLHANRTKRVAAHFHDREWAPFSLVGALSGRRESNPRSQFGRPRQTALLVVHLGRRPDWTARE